MGESREFVSRRVDEVEKHKIEGYMAEECCWSAEVVGTT